MIDGAKTIIGDKIRIIGQEYEFGYDTIIDIQGKFFIIEDGCMYKSTELMPYNNEGRKD